MKELAAGAVVAGKYRVIGVLGTGAMGVVYRAEQLDAEGRTLRAVALKTMQPSLSADPSFAKRFLREVRIAASLSSPYVVTIYDAGRTEDGTLYFTMELVRGRTLQEHLAQKGRLPVAEAVAIAAQICEAMAEAHGAAEPIIHRDLKPANIFVEDRRGEQRVKVNDFGIAKVIGEETTALTRGSSSPGTPRYMPPEQWRGETMDGRADLYALGVILYECLSGAPPFAGGLEAVMYKHLNEPPPPLPSSVPGPLRELAAKLLAKRADDRPRDALEVKRALDDVARDLEEPVDEATTPIARQHDERADVATTPLTPEALRAEPAAGRPGASASTLAAYAIVLVASVGGVFMLVRWLTSTTPPPVVAERAPISPTVAPPTRPAATASPIPTARSAPSPVPPTAVPPTAVPAPPTRAPVAVVPTPDGAEDCDRAPLSEADAKSWVESYRRALVAKDTAKLLELGAVRSAADADDAKRRLAPLRDLQIDIADLEINAEGDHGEISYSVSKRWRDAKLPTMVYDFDAEKRRLGRRHCRVVALP